MTCDLTQPSASLTPSPSWEFTSGGRGRGVSMDTPPPQWGRAWRAREKQLPHFPCLPLPSQGPGPSPAGSSLTHRRQLWFGMPGLGAGGSRGQEMEHQAWGSSFFRQPPHPARDVEMVPCPQGWQLPCSKLPPAPRPCGTSTVGQALSTQTREMITRPGAASYLGDIHAFQLRDIILSPENHSQRGSPPW